MWTGSSGGRDFGAGFICQEQGRLDDSGAGKRCLEPMTLTLKQQNRFSVPDTLSVTTLFETQHGSATIELNNSLWGYSEEFTAPAFSGPHLEHQPLSWEF